jgi:HAD superfamily hydrolase (TIGR01509 family)
MKIRALVFDFDGLILDTETPEFQAWQEVFAGYKKTIDLRTWTEYVGKASEEFDPHSYLESLVGRSLDRAEIKTRRKLRNSDLLSAQKLLPGVETCLSEAKDLRLRVGIASSSPRKWVLPHLERLGIRHYFDCIKTKDDVQMCKPSPDLYLSATRDLDVSPKEAIAFEDSPNGALAAKAAGLYCVAIPNDITRNLAFKMADLLLTSFADSSLSMILKGLEKSG